MRKLVLLFSIAFIGCNSADVSEVACNCNEVKDKKIVSHETPYLYWDYKLYVDFCDDDTRWVVVQQGQYNALNRGDCY